MARDNPKPERTPEPKRKPLPWPVIGEVPPACVACGYELAGAARCAECGLSHEDAVVLAGIPRRERGSKGRAVARWTLIAAAFLFSQGFVLLVVFVSPAIALAVFVAILVGTVALVMTGERGRSAAERVLVSRDGFVRVPLEPQAGAAPEPTPWTGTDSVHTTPVGAVWQKIRIMVAGPTSGRPRAVVDMGFRCRREELASVEAAVRALQRGEPLRTPPPECAPPA